MNFFKKRKLKALQTKVQRTHALREQKGGNENIKNEIAAQYALAAFYDQCQFERDLPRAEILALECYRAAAALGDVKAYYICGARLLDQGKFWDAWSKNPIYGSSIHKKYAEFFYAEALAYLREAEEQDFALAKRLLGMAIIQGWGVPRSMDEGYKKILDSIELEKAWDRATKIFEELKLSSPEFFAALRNYKGAV